MPWLGVAAAPDIGRTGSRPAGRGAARPRRANAAAPESVARVAFHYPGAALPCRAGRSRRVVERRAALRRSPAAGQVAAVDHPAPRPNRPACGCPPFTRNRCAAVRAELQRDAAATTRRRRGRVRRPRPGPAGSARRRVDCAATARLAAAAGDLRLRASASTVLPRPTCRRRRCGPAGWRPV